MTVPYNATMTLAKYLVDTVVKQGTGRVDPYCVGDRPRDRYFIGSLSPGASAEDVAVSDLKTRLSPTAMGLDVLVELGASTHLVLSPRFDVYYRVLPTLEQQLRAPVDAHLDAGDDVEPLGDETDAAEDSRETGRSGKRRVRRQEPAPGEDPSRELAIVFKKLPVEIEPINLLVGPAGESPQALGITELTAAMDRVLAAVCKEIQGDPDCYRQMRKRIQVPPHALESEDAFRSFLQGAVQGDPVVPQWAPKVEVTVRQHTDKGVIRVSVLLRNDSEEDKDRLTDRFLFDARLELGVEGGRFRPMRFWQDPKNYRYDPAVPGAGQNCVVEGDHAGSRVWTETVPVHAQKKYVTRERDNVSSRFADLAADPVRVLEKIASEMEAYHGDWKAKIENFRDQSTYTERVTDLTAFGQEIERFKDGISAIRRFPKINQAFRLMNETFRRQGAKKGYDTWRLFQLVFIVMNVPDLVTREYPQEFAPARLDTVDVLWFPTGGGKTESYLGLVVFAAFFDRLRGKNAGVTAWTRFPLRLLSLQQLQRIADVMVEADVLRQEIPEIATPDHKPFSVGYLVGKGNTPNNLVNYGDDQRPQYRDNPQRLQRFKIITRCPYCQGIDPAEPNTRQPLEVQLRYDEVRLVHQCRNPRCGKELPIYVVDNEIYRYLPTMVVGTVDKLAAVGNQRRFSHLFGAVTHECPDHGYLSLGECTQRYACKRKPGDFWPVSLKDPSPSLQIQDELHLLREGLGVFNSHYETFVDAYQQAMNNGARQKIIAATATIEDYRNHVYHLYRRKARRFPAPGPEEGESFYATTLTEIQRYYVGVMPHQKSHINTIIDTLLVFHREVQHLRKDPASGLTQVGLSIPVDQFLELLDKYEVSLTYVLAMKEGDRLTQSIRGQLADYLTRQGLHALDSVSMTGNTPFDEVGQTLDRLERPEGAVENHVHSIVATSMISHGVDVARLNFMVFYGMPRQTAEYIQSSSRVGRTYCGIAMVLFNPARERDQSHYHFFPKYHQFLDMLVEPVPINRWSKFSVRRTVTGLFMGFLLNYFMPQRKPQGIGNLYFASDLRRAIEQRLITEDEMLSLLFKAYGTGGREGNEFEAEIKQKVKDIFYLMSNPSKKMTSEMLDPAPMMSLRDVDKPLVIRARGASDRLLDLLYDD